MPTYQVTDPESGRKVKLTGDSPPTDDELVEIFANLPAAAPKQQPDSLGQKALNVAGEATAAVNRGFTQGVDFFTTDQVNNILQLAGSDKRIPSITELFAPATTGNNMQPGLARDVVRSAGEVVPAAVGVGGAIRSAANQLPKMANNAESVGAGVLRQMGKTSVGLDAEMGAMAGAGAAIGKELGGAEGELIGTMLAPASSPRALMSGGKAILQGAIRGESTPKQVAGVIDDFAVVGATPTAGQATKNEIAQGAESLSGNFWGGGALRKSVKNTSERVQEHLTKVADGISTKSGEDVAGRTIKTGITGNGGFIDRFKAQSGRLWSSVDDAIGQDTRVSIGNTKTALQGAVRSDAFGKILNDPKIVELLGAVETAGDDVTYEMLRSLRSSIGAKLSDNSLISDIPRSNLKQLYAALSNDIEVAANAVGANQQWSRANAYTRSGHDRIDGFIENITNKVDLEKVFDAVTRGGNNAATINSFKRSLNPDEWEVVVSNVVRNLGRSTAGRQNAEGDAFSLNQFLTDWNKLGANRNAMFSGSKTLDRYRNDLNVVARVAERVKESSQTLQNASGSGVFASNIGAIGAPLLAAFSGRFDVMAGVMGLVAANKSAAVLMSNPRFVSWLAKSVDKTPEQMASYIGVLSAVAQSSSTEEAEAIQGFIQQIEEQQSQSGPEGSGQ